MSTQNNEKTCLYCAYYYTEGKPQGEGLCTNTTNKFAQMFDEDFCSRFLPKLPKVGEINV